MPRVSGGWGLCKTPILVIIDHLLAEGTFDDEGRYERVGPQQEELERKRAIKALERLGYRVSADRVA